MMSLGINVIGLLEFPIVLVVKMNTKSQITLIIRKICLDF